MSTERYMNENMKPTQNNQLQEQSIGGPADTLSSIGGAADPMLGNTTSQWLKEGSGGTVVNSGGIVNTGAAAAVSPYHQT